MTEPELTPNQSQTDLLPRYTGTVSKTNQKEKEKKKKDDGYLARFHRPDNVRRHMLPRHLQPGPTILSPHSRGQSHKPTRCPGRSGNIQREEMPNCRARRRAFNSGVESAQRLYPGGLGRLEGDQSPAAVWRCGSYSCGYERGAQSVLDCWIWKDVPRGSLSECWDRGVCLIRWNWMECPGMSPF